MEMIKTLWSDWADQSFKRKWADEQKSPYEAMENEFLVDTALYKRAAARAKTADANSMLYLNKANSLFDISRGFKSYKEAIQSIKAKVLIIGADTDILFTDSQFRKQLDIFKQAGKTASFFEIKSSFGHLGGVLDITQASDTIAKFLKE